MKRLSFVAVLVVVSWPAAGQYKVVGPEGDVTYTDRPPIASNAKITAFSRRAGAPVAADADLPFDLRQVAARYPVTLYTTADCAPCDTGRQLLQQRGIPYTERTIVSDDDSAALERAVGGRTVPALSVGSQGLRGLSTNEWSTYLDAAGYPRESRLPRGWQAPEPTPLVERAARLQPRSAPSPEPAPPAAELPPADSGNNIKF